MLKKKCYVIEQKNIVLQKLYNLEPLITLEATIAEGADLLRPMCVVDASPDAAIRASQLCLKAHKEAVFIRIAMVHILCHLI
jgi:hypothetical protein